MTRLATPIFDHIHPNQLLIFEIMYQHAKKHFIPFIHSSDTVNLSVPSSDWLSAANKYSSTGHHEQKNKKANHQIKFSMVTIKQQIKPALQHSLCK